MAWRPLELTCPSCAVTLRPDLDLDPVRTDGGERLRGRDVTCRECTHEFEVFYL